ncbi:MAG: DUF58 domain-containing protein [Pseudomonadota bacterium]
MRAPQDIALDPRIHVSAPQLQRLAGAARDLRLLPRQPARSMLSGRHGSRLRGRGLIFEELRAYVDGDDIRTIDWKVTARTGAPHVRVYSEERDRPALILVDQRMSMFFGSQVYMKSVIAAEAAALVAHRILSQGDRVGGLVFTDDRMAEHRPQRSAAALSRLIGSIAAANQALGADVEAPNPLPIDPVLRAARRIATTGGLVIILSDFHTLGPESAPHIQALARHNDLLLCPISDPLAREMPKTGRLPISDAQLQAELDVSSPAQRAAVAEVFDRRLETLTHWSRRYQAPLLPLTTERPALDQLRLMMGLAEAPR